ncbi:MAG: hypothetical protein BWY64_02450 [bacterium ADurb.Bin363]|nr:MAG: hypothetical protein BWY64_02450 [bacterium ADurb.Bin363]
MRIHHLGYAVKNIDNAINEFLEIGYEKVGETILDEERKVIIQFVKNGELCIELVSPVDASSSINSIINKNGSTPYHICYRVDNITEAVVELKNNGYVLMGEPLSAVAIDSKKVVFMYNKHIGIIELVEDN